MRVNVSVEFGEKRERRKERIEEGSEIECVMFTSRRHTIYSDGINLHRQDALKQFSFPLAYSSIFRFVRSSKVRPHTITRYVCFYLLYVQFHGHQHNGNDTNILTKDLSERKRKREKAIKE